MTDPIADMLTRIRNANIAYLSQVEIPHSKIKEEIAKILKAEGFIKDYEVTEEFSHMVIKVTLKYSENKERVIKTLKRVSKPGVRIYTPAKKIPRLLGGLGLVIMSTSKGLMTGKKAYKLGLGGEILCYVW